MEMESTSGYDARISEINEVSVCFNTAPFEIQEDAFLRKSTDDLQLERDKIARDEAQIRSDDPCASQRQNIIVFRKAQLRQQEENLRKIPQGNVYQDRNVQGAYLGMMDPLFMVQGSILNVLLSICSNEDGLGKHPDQASYYSVKLSCLHDQLGKLHTAETQMGALDVQYASQPARALAEKSRLYWELMKNVCN